MLKILFFVLLGITCSTNTDVNARAFYDAYSALDAVGDTLTLILDAETFCFISTDSGYTAKATATDGTEIGSMNPDSSTRIAFLKSGGKVIITALETSLIVQYHILPIGTLSNFYKDVSYFIISSAIDEKFRFLGSTSNYQGTYYNSTLIQKLGLWMIKPALKNNAEYSTEAFVVTKNQILDAYTSNIKTDISDSTPQSPKSSMTTNLYYITSLSLFFYLKGTAREIDEQVEFYLKDYPTSDVNIPGTYTNGYRTAFKYDKTTSKDCVIKRGLDHLNNFPSVKLMPPGIRSFDFSINFGFTAVNQYDSIMIFPTIPTKLKLNEKYDIGDTFALHLTKYGGDIISFYPLWDKDEEISNDNTILMAIYINSVSADEYYVTSDPNKVFIVSNDETQAAITNDHSIYYVMSSLLNRYSTKVEFTGKVQFFIIKPYDIVEEVHSSGDIIDGPFSALIAVGSTCKFTSSTSISPLPSNLKNNCSFILKKPDSYIIYYSLTKGATTDITIKGYVSINMEKLDSLEIRSYLMVFVHNPTGWEGEIMPIGFNLSDNKIGPNFGRNAWYLVSSTNYIEEQIFLIRKTSKEKNFFLNVSTHILIDKSEKYRCSKVILTNKLSKVLTFVHQDRANKSTIGLKTAQNGCVYAPFIKMDIGVSRNDGASTTYINNLGNIQEQSDTFYSGNPQFEIINRYDPPPLVYIEYKKNTLEVQILIYDNSINYGIFQTGKLFYSEFNREIIEGIYTIPNQISDSDDDGGDEPDNTITLTNNTGSNDVDMSTFDSIQIQCEKSTMIVIHNKDSFKIEAYSNDSKIFSTMIASEKNGVITFGGSDGYLIVKKYINQKQQNMNIKITNVFSFSFMKYDTTSNGLGEARCNKIYLSNENGTYYVVKNTASQGNANIKVTNTDDYCIWFAMPVISLMVYNHHMYKTQYFFTNNEIKEEITSTGYLTAKSIFILGKHMSGDDSRPKNSDYKIVPLYSDHYDPNNFASLSFESDEGIKIPSKNEIIGKESADVPPSNTPPSNDPPKTIIIVAIVVVVVVILIIIIVVVVVVKKKNKKNASTSNP